MNVEGVSTTGTRKNGYGVGEGSSKSFALYKTPRYISDGSQS